MLIRTGRVGAVGRTRALIKGGGGSGPIIGGVAIGTAGAPGTVYEGLKLIEGDDFDAMPSRWTGRNLSGRYHHSRLHQPLRQQDTSDRVMVVDPSFRGARSESPTPLGVDRLAVSSSVMTLTAAAPDAGTVAFLPTTYSGRGDGANKPQLLSGALKSAPSFMLSAQADFVMECRVRLAAGVARGYWPSFWTSTFFWPDRGEIDIVEAKKDGSGNMISLMNVFGNASDGAAAQVVTVATPAYPANQWINVMAKRVGNTISFYDDAAVPGTYALRGSTTSFVARLSGAHDVRFDMSVSTVWDGSTFNLSDWPKSVEFDWWRAWVPAAAGPNRAATILPAVNTSPGGSWAATFPSAVDLHGGAAGLEQFTMAAYSYDSPGVPTRDAVTRLPASMTLNSTTRAITGTVPTTEGGTFSVLITYAYNDGTPANRVFLPYNVASAVQGLFASVSAPVGQPFSVSVPYTAFHSGDLGPHTYTATSDKAWATITGGGTGSLTISGTAPGSADTASISITCTNSIGQQTTVTRTVTAQAAAAFALSDTFSYAVGDLNGRTNPDGWSWVTHPTQPIQIQVTAGGTLQVNGINVGMCRANTVPPSPNYFVEVQMLVAVATGAANVVGRMDATAATFYNLQYNAGTGSLDLQRRVAGSSTTLGSFAASLTLGSTATMRLVMNGDQISGVLNGVERISVTDTSPITAAGFAGVRLFNNSTTDPTNSPQITSITAGSL